MTHDAHTSPILSNLDTATAELVRLAVSVAIGSEQHVRDAMARAVAVRLEPLWVEELVLQTYLFAGFPRALNAAREWRRASARPAPVDDEAMAPMDAERLREPLLRRSAPPWSWARYLFPRSAALDSGSSGNALQAGAEGPR